jgi:pimeloyl-ACP methyl ester carboxylesterase
VKTRLVTFRSTDGVRLPGLLYEPGRPSREAAIFLHGNGDSSVFYSARRTNAFGEELNRRGISWLAFNNRGAHFIKRLNRRRGTRADSVMLGMTYELVRDCVPDIEGAIGFLREEGYRRFHLVGHSTGANKIAIFNRRRPRNRISRYVLLAPGDDVGIYYHTLGARRFHRALETAQVRVEAGRGLELVPPSISPFPISWMSLLDTIDPDGDYNTFPFLDTMRGLDLSRRTPFRDFRTIRKPTLALYGSEDEFCFGEVPRCVEILREKAREPRRLETVIIPGADHGFSGEEHRAGAIVARFLSERSR